MTETIIEAMRKPRSMERAILDISLKDLCAPSNERRDQRWGNIINKYRQKRGRGRPQVHWSHDIKNVGGYQWRRKVKNRQGGKIWRRSLFHTDFVFVLKKRTYHYIYEIVTHDHWLINLLTVFVIPLLKTTLFFD